MSLKPRTYGTLPTEDEFREAFSRLPHHHCNQVWAEMAEPSCQDFEVFEAWHADNCERSPRFEFSNDPRVGTCELTCSELWKALVQSHAEWSGDLAESEGVLLTEADRDAAGQWCSDVLGVLGWEWV